MKTADELFDGSNAHLLDDSAVHPSGYITSDDLTPDQVAIIHLEADLEIAREKLRQIEAIVDKAPELNMSNFDVNQVADLNNAMIEVYMVLQPDEDGEVI